MKKNLTIKEIFTLAQKNHQKNNLKVAENLYNRILEINPNQIEVVYLLGSLLLQARNFIKAKLLLQKAIKINPNHVDAHNNLGLVFKELKEYQKAKDSYEKAIQINSNYVGGYNNLGVVLREMGEHKKAIACYEKAIEIKPNFTSAHYNLGIVFKELKKFQKAIACYEKAIEIKPNFTSAHYNLAIIFKLLKEYQKAIKSLQKIDTTNSRTELLECTYFFYGLEPYQKRLEKLVKQDPLNIKIAAMAAYVSKKENIKNIYPFCKNPLNFIFKQNIKNRLTSTDKFYENLLELLRKVQCIWEPLSTTTKGGYQTLGNLFNSNDIEILKLQKIIKDQIDIYRETYKSSEEHFITKWPQKCYLNAWHVKLLKEGHQEAHIHPSKWLSGVFYLKVPKPLNKNEGSIKFQLYGYDYPEDKNLPNLIHSPKAFDLVLFPSSLFHRTIPFTSHEERHSIAFDLIPK